MVRVSRGLTRKGRYGWISGGRGNDNGVGDPRINTTGDTGYHGYRIYTDIYGYISDIYQIYIGYISDIYRIYIGYIRGYHWEEGELPRGFRVPRGNTTGDTGY